MAEAVPVFRSIRVRRRRLTLGLPGSGDPAQDLPTTVVPAPDLPQTERIAPVLGQSAHVARRAADHGAVPADAADRGPPSGIGGLREAPAVDAGQSARAVPGMTGPVAARTAAGLLGGETDEFRFVAGLFGAPENPGAEPGRQ